MANMKYLFWKQAQHLFVIGSLLLVLLCCSLCPGFTDDIYCWINWADAIREKGLRNVYDTDTNYLPVYHYILWAYAKLAPNRDFLIAHIHWLRYITLVIDIAGLWILYQWTDKRVSFPVILIVSLLNLSYIYDNIIWGQVDGILATLAFAALYCVYQRSYIWGAVWLSIMLNFKLQGIVFVPLYGLVLLAQNDLKHWPKYIFQSLLVLLCMEALILFPFMLKEGGLQQVYHMLSSLVGYVPKVSSLAYNFWTFLLGADADITPDARVFIAGWTYKQAGLLLFAMGSFCSLWPLLSYIVRRRIQGKDIDLPKEDVWLMAALIALLFFYFNTQMHERYSYPAFIFIAAYSFYRKDFVPYILFSYLFLANMESILRWIPFDNHGTVLFDRRLIALGYGILITYLYYQLYRGPHTRNSVRVA